MRPSTLSVVMPNYNHAKYLELSLGAILAQSRPAQEILVIDDASTDDSLAIIEALAARNPSVRIIRNPKNAGVVSCMNFGVKVATGDYIYFAGADDEVRPGLFEQSLEVLEKHPTAALSCCDEAFFHEDTGESSERRLNIRGEPCYLTPAEVAEIKRHLRSTFIYGNTVIIRRAVLDEMKGFDPDLKWSCDDFAFNVAAFRYGLCYLPRALAILRVHSSSYSAAGATRRPIQRKVEDHLLRLLNSDAFSDILPFYKSCGKLKQVFPRMLLYPGFWKHIDLDLLRQGLWFEFRRSVMPLVPERMTKWYYDRLDRHFNNWQQRATTADEN